MKKTFKEQFTDEQVNFWMESSAWVNNLVVEYTDDGNVARLVDPWTYRTVVTRRAYIDDMARGWH